MKYGIINDQYYFESDNKKKRIEFYMTEESYKKFIEVLEEDKKSE